MDTSRLILCDRQGNPLCDIAPGDVFERRRTEVLNGEHALSVTTTRVLERGQRLLTCDATGTWREYVVESADEEHAEGRRAYGTYYSVWSLQYDLSGSTVSRMPGTTTPVAASVALGAALSGTSRWQVGTVTQTSTGGASMYQTSAWEALGVLVENWGGEISATVTVDGDGVVSRRVNLLAHEGRQTPLRRFDYSRDLKSVRRSVGDSTACCRIIPRGKGEETEGGGTGRKITIESVNGGIEWLQDDEMAAVLRLPDGAGGWEYPTVYVDNSDMETPQALKDWGLQVLEDYTRPKVTYEADVVQLAEAGMDVKGLALGDEVQVVDRAFGGDGLRLQGRVVKLVTDELEPSSVKVTLGYLSKGMADVFADLKASISLTRQTVEAINGGSMSTADYLSRLIDRLNYEINASGGYTYITEGQGIRTYDRAVSDPLVGAEATKVVEIKGGSIRIADSKTAGGEWEWRTVFVSGHIAADMVTAANITSGYIGSAASGNYWNLDTGELQMASTTTVGGQTVQAIADGAANTAKTQAISAAAQDAQTRVANLDNSLTQAEVLDRLTGGYANEGLYISNGHLYINASYIKSGTVNADLIDVTDLIVQRLGMSAENYASIGKISGVLDYNGLRYHNTESSADTGFYLGVSSTQANNAIYLGIIDDEENSDLRAALSSDYLFFTSNTKNYPRVQITFNRTQCRFAMYSSATSNKTLVLDQTDGLYLQKTSGSTVTTEQIAYWPS